MAVLLSCQICSAPFSVAPGRQETAKYCSYDCLWEAKRKEKVRKECEYCHQGFSVLPCRVDTARFCSTKCLSISTNSNRKGIPRTELEKKKMSDALREQFINGRKAWNRGATGLQINERKGEKSNFWKGGTATLWMEIINSIQYKSWRKAVYQRDEFKCVWCGSQTRIEADHIVAKAGIVREFLLVRPELKHKKERLAAILENCDLLWDTRNGRTLCHECHKTTDTYAGKKKNLINSLWRYLRNADGMRKDNKRMWQQDLAPRC